jgi:hypothetical protein
MLAWADIRRPLIRARFAKRISSLLRAEGFSNEKIEPLLYWEKKDFQKIGTCVQLGDML